MNADRVQNATAWETPSATEIVDLIGAIGDPEMPFVSIKDLGILRSIEIDGTDLRVTVTPTYSGCPALAAIEARIRHTGASKGFAVTIDTVLSPAWTTDWITETGRAALAANATTPPAAIGVVLTLGAPPIACPQCGSVQTERLGDFGATACRAIRRCRACGEPFDEFKTH